MKTAKEFLQELKVPIDLGFNGITVESMLNDFSEQFKIRSPEEAQRHIELWRQTMNAANEVIEVLEKKPSRSDLLKQIDELNATLSLLKPTTPRLIPFSLERALAGDKVVSRQGDEIKEIRVYESSKDNRNIVCTVNGVIRAYTVDGCWYEDKTTCGLDLFMAPHTVTKYVNVYLQEDGRYTVGAITLIDSEAKAKSIANTSYAIATVPITIQIK